MRLDLTDKQVNVVSGKEAVQPGTKASKMLLKPFLTRYILSP